MTTAILVGIPLIVVATVAVKATSPVDVVIVWRGRVGRLTRTMLVGIPLIVVGKVAVTATLPDKAVIV